MASTPKRRRKQDTLIEEAFEFINYCQSPQTSIINTSNNNLDQIESEDIQYRSVRRFQLINQGECNVFIVGKLFRPLKQEVLGNTILRYQVILKDQYVQAAVLVE